VYGWTEPSDISARLEKKWKSGAVLREVLRAYLDTSVCAESQNAARDLQVEDGCTSTLRPGFLAKLFPLTFTIKGPTAKQIAEDFLGAARWIKRLHAGSRAVRGSGYEVIEEESGQRSYGRNRLPVRAVIATLDDALNLLGKERDAEQFADGIRLLLEAFPDASAALCEWAHAHPFKIMGAVEDWAGIVAVLQWFCANPHSGLYMRQVDIPGIDTKFIESHQALLTSLLVLVLPAEATLEHTSSFEERFGLRSKPRRVRLRFLDPALYVRGLCDIQVTSDELALLRPAVTTVFITENEINGLSFPNFPQSLVFFGLGYAVDVLKGLPWLHDVRVYYWGDIDTNGMAILNRARITLPQTQSLLMDEDILLRYRSLWSTEPQQFQGTLAHLTDDEATLYSLLKTNSLAPGVRLEQERIPYHELTQALIEVSSLSGIMFEQ